MSDLLVIVVPVFWVVLLGYVLGRIGLFKLEHSETLINFVWFVGIPFYLFRAMAPASLPSLYELQIAAAYYLALFCVYALAYHLARFAFKIRGRERAVFALTSCLGNGAFLGLPLVELAYGAEGVRVLLIIVPFHTLSLFVVSTYLLALDPVDASAAQPQGRVLTAVRALASVWRNPITLSLFAGMIWSGFGLPFPVWLDKMMAFPAAAAAPVGLFSAGLAMTGVQVEGDRLQAVVMAAIKLSVLPLVVYLTTRFLFQFDDVWVGSATLMAGLPTAMVGYSFASQHAVAPRRTASAILLSMTGAVLTLSILLTLLR